MKRILYRILLGLNVILAFALLISYLAVHISPEDFALPALFGLAYPYLLLANIIMIIAWVALLRYEAFISVIVIAAGFTHFSNYIKLVKPSGTKAGAFKVLSYNVRLFNYFESRNGVSSEQSVLEFLKTQDPDILCMQEFYMTGVPSQKEAAIKRMLGWFSSHTDPFS